MNSLGFIGKISCALLLALIFGWAATHTLGMEVPSIKDGGLASELTNTIVWLGGGALGGFLGYKFAKIIYVFILDGIVYVVMGLVGLLWS